MSVVFFSIPQVFEHFITHLVSNLDSAILALSLFFGVQFQAFVISQIPIKCIYFLCRTTYNSLFSLTFTLLAIFETVESVPLPHWTNLHYGWGGCSLLPCFLCQWAQDQTQRINPLEVVRRNVPLPECTTVRMYHHLVGMYHSNGWNIPSYWSECTTQMVRMYHYEQGKKEREGEVLVEF